MIRFDTKILIMLLMSATGCSDSVRDDSEIIYYRTTVEECENYLVSDGYKIIKNNKEKEKISKLLSLHGKTEKVCIGIRSYNNKICYFALPVQNHTDGDIEKCI